MYHPPTDIQCLWGEVYVLKKKLCWIAALGLLGASLLGRIRAPQGFSALQQTVFGRDSSAVETAVAVFVAGGSFDEVIACVAPY